MRGKSIGLVVCMAVLILSSIFSASARNEETPPLVIDKDKGIVTSDLDKLVPELLEKSHVPGLQIALIRDGKLAWNGSYGIMSTAGTAPVTDETIFEAASLTKPFFAYYVMMLVDEGTIDLDSPIMEYLPREEIEKLIRHSLDTEGFRLDWFERITARHVLSHAAGMPHGEGGSPYPLFSEPGTKYKYSAEGYFYLQKAVEHLKGEKLEDLMKKNVIDPLGMKHSCMVWRDAYESTMANGHDAYGTPQDFRKRNESHAGASLYTTAADYALFVCAVINGDGLKKETWIEMLTPQVEVDKERGLTWSLGFSLQKDKNGKAFWQWGDYGIFRNYIIAYPEQKTAMVYLANSFHGLSICGELVAKSIGGKARGNEFLQYPAYDSPLVTFAWAVMKDGPQAVEKLLPGMLADNPDMLSDRSIGMISNLLTEGEMYDEAIAFYTFLENIKPGSAALKSLTARAYLEKGDYSKAKDNYLHALDAPNKEHFDSTSVDWALKFIEALDKPMTLPEDYLKTLAGDYGPRHIKFEDGRLYYFRDNAAAADYRELIPISKDTFVMRELIYFRMRFELDENGTPVRIVGLYEWGFEDQSPRDK